MDDDELAVGGQVDVELHAETVLAGTQERGHRVLGRALAVQAAVRVTVSGDLAPLLVDHGVSVARRQDGAGRARHRDGGSGRDGERPGELLCVHIYTSNGEPGKKPLLPSHECF
ncbi:hypothetical protein [Paratractidigestivibacter sp.]|uniref:hypothetical protein n=1 Tax=Paratractidigestivibacter sp. TaxID=2847316 RepID=UPI0040294C58